MAYGPKAQLQLLQLIGIKTPNWTGMLAMMVFAVVLLLLLTSAVWLLLQRKNDPVVQLYRKFCNKMKKIGLERGAAEGPADYARRLIRARPELREPVGQITTIYVKLRYGRFSTSGLALLRKRVNKFRVSPTTTAARSERGAGHTQ